MLNDKYGLKQKFKFTCETCNYKTNRKCNYNEHLITKKHNDINESKQDYYNFLCLKCNKKYKERSGLWKHSKKCIFIDDDDQSEYNDEPSEKDLIQMLIKDNQELKEIIIDQNKTMQSLASNIGNNNNNTTNSNNTFNLNFYLNETCKDAMNINEFVDSITPTLYDLEETGRLGYTEGITKIIVKKLKDIQDTYRPFHCSDIKRQIIHVKSNNKWEKEDDNKPILINAIKKIAYKNIDNISHWANEHPEYSQYDSKYNDKYLEIVSNSMSGSTQEEQHKNMNKIVSNLAKEIVIKK